MGLGRLELPTSRLSSARSNQLSYKPKAKSSANTAIIPKGLSRSAFARPPLGGRTKTVSHRIAPAGPSTNKNNPTQTRPGRKRSEDDEVPQMNPEGFLCSKGSKRGKACADP